MAKSRSGAKARSGGKAVRRGVVRRAAPAGPPKSLGRARTTVIVGIGASAGGLEALEQFLRHVPEASGLAFVVVQHLDPTREGLLPELLQRATTMKVAQVKDRVRVRPGCVYVIPPGDAPPRAGVMAGGVDVLEPVKRIAFEREHIAGGGGTFSIRHLAGRDLLRARKGGDVVLRVQPEELSGAPSAMQATTYAPMSSLSRGSEK